GDDIDAARFEPIGQPIKISGKATELTHRLLVAVGRHGHEMRGATDVDAGSIRVSQSQAASTNGPVALRHGVLHHLVVERGAGSGTSSAHSLKRDIDAKVVSVWATHLAPTCCVSSQSSQASN